MQTSIDRSSRRVFKHRRGAASSNQASFVREAGWLSWPLIRWSRQRTAHVAAAEPPPDSLYAALVRRLSTCPEGLYALQLTGPAPMDFRLLEVTGARLGMVAHTIALLERQENDGVTGLRGAGAQGRPWQKRLRLLSACLREISIPSARLLQGASLLQAAWRLDKTGVEAPGAVMRLLGKGLELSMPGADRAIFEFVLRKGTARLSQFIAALQVLAGECRLVDGEPARRRQVLCSILREAAITQPPFLPVFHQMPNGVRTHWRLNIGFGGAAREIFLKRHLPDAVSRHWTEEDRQNYTFEKMCLQLVGVEVAPFNQRKQLPSAKAPDAVAQLLAMLEAIKTASWERQQAQLAILAAQYAAAAGNPDAPRSLACWLQACRQLGRLTTGAGDIWSRAIHSLQTWLQSSSWESENLQRLLDLLTVRSPEIFSDGWIRIPMPGAAFRSLARFGRHSLGEVLAIIDFDLLEYVHQSFSGKTGQLSALLGILPENPVLWAELPPGYRGRWMDLFAVIEDGRLAGALREWVIHLRRDRAFTFLDVSRFIGAIEEFLDRGKSERTPREAFLRSHMAVLDRILDEVETSLLELPATGFEEWRSHEILWDSWIGSLEILYQWESAGFAHGSAMVDELFHWCRQTDRRRMKDRWKYPPAHFRNVQYNEALVTRLSGGVPRRLLNLLEQYTELWNRPDNPLDGWLFLDRYPAVQESLQQFCRQPRKLYGTMKVLRRLALAVRLQQRAALGDGLARWMAASSQNDAIARMRGLREIARCATSLPPAIEKIQMREKSLRAEWETLSAMERERRLSPSASVRLSKVGRLLRDPAAITRWVEKDVDRACAKMLPRVQFQALSAISRAGVRAHWKQVIDPRATGEGGDWDNALHFYYSAEKNKELLREVLRHAAGQDAQWRLRHPPNARFADALRAHGLQIESWLAPLTMTRQVPGATWTVYLEQDPLRVLQMGNLFGTCLSLDDCNAFAAIANAAEINKQVLYLRDEEGVVIGRKLLGLTTAGQLFGFRSYGASSLDAVDGAEKPRGWIKLLFDLACLEIVHRMGAQFDQSPNPVEAAQQLQLSAEWYNDGPEPFDWWIVKSEFAEDILNNNRATVADAVAAHIRQNGLDVAESTYGAMESLRALLWLGDDAVPVIESVGRETIPPKCARFLHSQASSAAVRALFAGS